MPPAHRKLRRKELKQPDEFTAFFEDAEEWLFNNLRQVIIAAAVVVVVGLVALGAYSYERYYDHLTAQQFYSAFNALSAKQYKLAEREFMDLAASEPGRELGRLARFYLANCYLAENDLPRARDSLVAYLAEAHDPTFRQLALHNLGVVYEKMGDFKKAESMYAEAATMPGPQQADSELGAARMLERQGNRQAAIAAYRRFLEERPFAPQRAGVIETLSELGAPVDASAAPAATPGAR
jgi:tetratricopeptide (TPR) repeat protein